MRCDCSSTLSFTHNPAGQIVGNTRSNDAYSFNALANANVGDSHDGLNRLVDTGGTSPSHDARGNLTSDGTATYGYDSENRMVSGPNDASLGHDPLGRLARLTSSIAGNRFLHDGAEIAAVYDDNGGLVRRVVRGPGADAPLVLIKADGTRRCPSGLAMP